jgi:hypothetical protein
LNCDLGVADEPASLGDSAESGVTEDKISELDKSGLVDADYPVDGSTAL